MKILAESVEYIQIGDLTGPAADLTGYPVAIALMPDDGTEPAAGDWKPAIWLPNNAGTPEPSVLCNTWPAGQYMAYVQVTAPPEVVALPSGRVRIGDTRS
jgi:hypothetical protein